MTNTYPEDAPYDLKLLEEMRCTRSVLERILRVMDEGLFTDYQMEKFGTIHKKALKDFKDSTHKIYHIVEKDSKNYSKGQITGSYKPRKKIRQGKRVDE